VELSRELAKQLSQRPPAILHSASGHRNEGIGGSRAWETKHFTNDGRTITVEQQVEKDAPRIVHHLKTNAAKRGIATYIPKLQSTCASI
jgi:hypothetical protein